MKDWCIEGRHEKELRYRIIACCSFLLIAFIILYPFSGDLLKYFLMNSSLSLPQHFVYLSPIEYFVARIRVESYVVFFLFLPFFGYHLWRFTVPGLYGRERIVFSLILFLCPLLSMLGGVIGYFIVMPIVLEFFTSLNTEGVQWITFTPRVTDYLDFMSGILLIFICLFQIPALMSALWQIGLWSAQSLKEKRRYVVLGSFLLGAIFTPPDPLSQIILALCLIFLYEVGLKLIYFLERRKKLDARYSRNEESC